jgi:hypothetical protein
MKKTVRKIAVSLTLLAILLSLGACGVSDADIKTLVKGNLDQVYLGVYDPRYLEIVDTTQEQAASEYEAGLETDVELFTTYFGIEYPTQELIDEIKELYKQVYAKSDYTVGEPYQIDSRTYGVDVKIRPVDVFKLVTDDWDAGMRDFFSSYTEEDIANMTRAEYEAYDQDWARRILDLFWAKLPQLGHLEEVNLVMNVNLGGDDLWVIEQADMEEFYGLVVYLP